MNHILNYLRWRGDLSFEKSGLNEVDRLVLAYASYAELAHYMGPDSLTEPAPVKQVALEYRKKKHHYKLAHPEWNEHKAFVLADRVFAEMSRTERFGDIEISDYEQRIDPETTEQFAAECFKLPGGLRYVSFSGTDETVIGWLEDFDMSYRAPVPAQQHSEEYLLRLLEKYPEDTFLIGGHSKGGNLAIYAAARAAEHGLDGAILGIDAFDSPGFLHPFLGSDGFRKIHDRIHAYIPEGSVVGLLLFRDWELNIVKNRARNIGTQHACGGWETMGTEFVRADSLNENTVSIGISVQETVNRMSPEELKHMCDRIAAILEESGIRTVPDFSTKSGKLMQLALHEYHESDSEERSRIGKVLTTMIKIYNDSKSEKI